MLGAVVGAKVGRSSGDLAGSLSNDIVNVGAQLIALKFSRKQEIVADRLSVSWMIEAGYNPQGMMRLQNMLGMLKPKKKGASILSTHPTSAKRYKSAKKIIARAKVSKELLDKPQQPLVPIQTLSEIEVEMLAAQRGHTTTKDESTSLKEKKVNISTGKAVRMGKGVRIGGESKEEN